MAVPGGVPGGVPGMAVPGGVPGGVPGMAVPGGVPGMAVPGGVPGATPGAGVVGQQSVTPPVIKRPGWTPAMGPMNPNAALALLMGNGFGAKSYYNGVPDLSAGANKREVRTRDVIKSKLLDIVIPKVDPLHDVTMNEVVTRLQLLLRQSDPSGVGFNMVVNQFIDPGGAAIAPTPAPGGGAAGPAGPGGGMAIDPVTGLPIDGGGDPGGAAPQIDPVTGLPITGAPAGFPGGVPGVPGAGGGIPGMAGPGLGGVPGMGGMPGMGGGMPGMGGGEAPSTAMQGAFDPSTVKINGLTGPLFNIRAKDLLDTIVMSFDHPIQYVVLDTGIMFFQQDPKFAGTVTRTFSLNLNSRSLAQLGIQTPQLGQGGGGGQGQGGGQGGGQGPGGYPGGADPSGGGYPEGGGSGEPQMAMPKYGGYPKMRPFNSMGGYYAPGNFNSFSARPQGFPNFRR